MDVLTFIILILLIGVIIAIVIYGVGIYVLYRIYKSIFNSTNSRLYGILIIAAIVTFISGLSNIVQGNNPDSKYQCILRNNLQTVCTDVSDSYKTWGYIMFGISGSCILVSILYRIFFVKPLDNRRFANIRSPQGKVRSFSQYRSPKLPIIPKN